MQIQGGTGNNYTAGVSDEFRLMTETVATPDFLHRNYHDGSAYVWNFPSYNAANADTVMFVQNDSNTNLHIHHAFLWTDAATTVTVHTIKNGETPAGTAVTGVNLKRGSGNVAEATAIQDETGNSSQGTILQLEYATANTPLTIFKEEGYEVILGKNDCIAIDLTTGSSAATFGHIVGYYHA